MTGHVSLLYISTCYTSGSVSCRQRAMSLSCTFQRAALLTLHSADDMSGHFQHVVLLALFIAQVSVFMFVSCIKRCLFADLCQTRVVRRYEKTNVRWKGGRHTEMFTLRKIISNSFCSIDIIFSRLSVCLSPYHFTFVCWYKKTRASWYG